MWRGLISTHRQARKLILGPSLTATTRLLSFNMTQSMVVIGLLAGHNTLRRYLYTTGLIDSPLCRRCGAEEEISALKTHLFGLLFLDPGDIRSLSLGNLELQ